MKKYLLFLLLTIAVCGMANAQKGLKQFKKTSKKEQMPRPEPKPIRGRNNGDTLTKTGTTLRGTSYSSIVKVGSHGPKTPSDYSRSPTEFTQQEMQQMEIINKINDRFRNAGFIPRIHSTPPPESRFSSDNLLQEIQRQESLSKEQDKLRGKIYKSLNKLNSTEWESTITGHIIYSSFAFAQLLCS